MDVRPLALPGPSVVSCIMAPCRDDESTMPYRPFHDFFPQLAERETRTILVPPKAGEKVSALPEGEYALVEMYCDERGCDWRRIRT